MEVINSLKQIWRWVNIINRISPSEVSEFEGLQLPGKHLRPGGKHFKSDSDYVNSAKMEVQRLFKSCGLNSKSRLLDFGCGPGRLAYGIILNLPSINKYVGLDVNQRSIDFCQHYITPTHPSMIFMHLDIANLRYNAKGNSDAEGTSLPLGDDSYDIIYLYSVFSHLLDKDISYYLSEFRRLLVSGGKVFLTAFVEDGVDNVTENPADYQEIEWKGPLHCVLYNRIWFDDILAKHGFSIDSFVHGQETDGQSAYILTNER